MPHDLRVTCSVSGIVLISGIALQTSSHKQSISIAVSNQASDNSLANLQNRNVPIQSEGIVPNDGLVHSGHSPNHISKKKVEEFAVQRYGTCGQGIDFSDVSREFHCSKPKAQRILKDSCQQGILFTPLKRTRTQQFFPTCIRAEIVEHLSKRKNVLIDPTEVTSPKAPLSTLEQHKAQNLLDALLLLCRSPPYIHKLQLRLAIDPRYYKDIQRDCSRYNREKHYEERIGRAVVKYSIYPNGTTMVYVACSNNPFKLEDEITLYSFLGQVRDRLVYFLPDPHERRVPPLTEWILTGWDINKDIAVTDMLQLSAPNIQLKEANRVFRLYIKSLGDKAVYRVDESLEMRSSIVDALDTIIGTVQSQDYTKYIQDPEITNLSTQDLD
jgi:hypothetical protein